MAAPSAKSNPPPLLLWVLLPGAAGFLAGFLGPVVLNPEANLGPLLGIFVTGPGGALLGLLLGLACRLLRVPALLQWQLQTGVCAVLVAGALFLSLPGPTLRGHVIDAEIRDCRPPAMALDRAMAFWEKRLAGTATRPGWQADVRRKAERDPGAILELNVTRKLAIYQHRKPWNRGRITANGWQDMNSLKRYYVPNAVDGCADYRAGTKSRYFATTTPSAPAKGPREWPPTGELPVFLDLPQIGPVPDEYQQFVE